MAMMPSRVKWRKQQRGVMRGNTITGHATIDGSGDYTYTCYVEDNGEPGHGVDYFRLSITETGYNAEDYLAGGNIQIHAK